MTSNRRLSSSSGRWLACSAVALAATVGFAVAPAARGDAMTDRIQETSSGPATKTAADRDPEVERIRRVVTGIYECISGDAGVARDWARMQSLMTEDAKLMAIVPPRGGEDGVGRVVMTLDEYRTNATRMFEERGFHEREVTARVERYGHVAHVFSTYESRWTLEDPEPFDRGINSIQLVRTGDDWRVVSILWDSERTGGPIPATYLAPAD